MPLSTIYLFPPKHPSKFTLLIIFIYKHSLALYFSKGITFINFILLTNLEFQDSKSLNFCLYFAEKNDFNWDINSGYIVNGLYG